MKKWKWLLLPALVLVIATLGTLAQPQVVSANYCNDLVFNEDGTVTAFGSGDWARLVRLNPNGSIAEVVRSPIATTNGGTRVTFDISGLAPGIYRVQFAHGSQPPTQNSGWSNQQCSWTVKPPPTATATPTPTPTATATNTPSPTATSAPKCWKVDVYGDGVVVMAQGSGSEIVQIRIVRLEDGEVVGQPQGWPEFPLPNQSGWHQAEVAGVNGIWITSPECKFWVEEPPANPTATPTWTPTSTLTSTPVPSATSTPTATATFVPLEGANCVVGRNGENTFSWRLYIPATLFILPEDGTLPVIALPVEGEGQHVVDTPGQYDWRIDRDGETLFEGTCGTPTADPSAEEPEGGWQWWNVFLSFIGGE